MRTRALRGTVRLLFLLAASNHVINADERALSPSPQIPKLVVFSDGTQVAVRYYELRDKLVVFETTDGKLRSVSRAYVDVDATERINCGFPRRETPAKIEAPADGSAEPNRSSKKADGANEGAPTIDSFSANATPAYLAVRSVIIDGPPPPQPPDMVSRDEAGRVTLRAVRLLEPVVVDGRLDDAVYHRVPAVTNFIQQEPDTGQPATEQTEVWIFFDDETLYIAARCWDSQPERIVTSELRRGHVGLARGDILTVVLDTFYDRRNGYFFMTNPLGGVYDSLVTDERNENIDWDTVWDTRSARFDQGWSVEMAFPFKSLRYKASGDQVWGINFRRIVPSKNEMSFLNPASGLLWPNGDHEILVGCDPGRARAAGQIGNPGGQAVRDLRGHDRHRRLAACLE